MTERFDVVIVGGRCAGATLARVLAEFTTLARDDVKRRSLRKQSLPLDGADVAGGSRLKGGVNT